ncbi:hypothetical protein RN001_000631 [Aquatica leii]|uniref:Uncharacterized protein n=1 Tax=Aquatica leii TaxID=1421715 RepID=A0AAN7Q9S6_9COLE|nr:hypothetical protein RN001_000631 [Aquatica leii]
MELSANLIRAQNIQNASNPSILESENTSKGLSPTSLDFLPPAYEDIFGIKNSDLPPSYSEISLMFRKLSRENLNKVRASDNKFNVTPTPQESILKTSFSAPFILNERLFNLDHRMRHAFVSLENNLERNLSNSTEVEACDNLPVGCIQDGETAQEFDLQLNNCSANATSVLFFITEAPDMNTHWIYLAFAIIFAFSYIHETVARSVDGSQIKERIESAVALVPEPVAAGYKQRYRRSPKKHKKHGHVIIVHHHHHGHHGHYHHHG